MASSSSSDSGLFLSSISLCQEKACSCSGVIDIRCPGVGVAMPIALLPVGVTPLGVMLGVMAPGVILGVMPPGVMLGVIAPGVMLGVMAEGVWLAGVSSHLDLRLLAPGVGVLSMRSPPRSVFGVSAQPLPCPGVSAGAGHGTCSNKCYKRENNLQHEPKLLSA